MLQREVTSDKGQKVKPNNIHDSR